MSAWIFQGNPDDENFNVEANVESLKVWDWTVKINKNKVKKGHRAYIWVSESKRRKMTAGIIASGIITCDPEERDGEDGPVVDIEFDRKFISAKVQKDILRADRRTENLMIIRMPFGRNPFPVTEEEEEVIESIIRNDGSYVQDPSDVAKNMKKYLSLLKENKNLILTGAPGTGKTFLAKKMARILLFGEKEAELPEVEFEFLHGKEFEQRHAFVQFHPSYDYTDFVEGLRPTKPSDENRNVGFERTDGVFKAFCKDALKDKDQEYVFIIDEINRGEISKIFGELFFSIEPDYRGTKGKMKTQYQNMMDKTDPFYDGFYIPENVYIIGTMNDIDRSVESFDFAMRRRFVWKEITAKESAENMGLDHEQKAIMKRLNDALWSNETKIEGLSSSYHIGASYFLKETDIDKLWELKLNPLLKEYLRGRPDADKEMEKLENAYYGNRKTADSQE